MKLKIGLVAGLLALGGCGSDEGGTGNGTGTATDQNSAANAQGENAQAQNAAAIAGGERTATAGDVKLRAGQWEMRTEVAALSAPGMPAAVADMMKSQTTTATICISEEEASRSDSSIFTGKKDSNCSTEGFEAKGGRVSGTVTCAGEGGQGKLTMAMDGEFKPESYQVSTKMQMTGGSEGMVVESKTSGRRIGDCPAGKAV